MAMILIHGMSVAVVIVCASDISESSSFTFILLQDEYVSIHGKASLEFK